MGWIDDEGKYHTGNKPNSAQNSVTPPVSTTTTPIYRPQTIAQQRRKVYCSDRSYLIAGILAIELGFLGVHNFYSKYYKKGGIQLAVSIISLFLMNASGFFVLVFIGTWVWGIVEGILLFKGKIDSDGDGDDFWRSWYFYLTSAEYIRPYSYPHIKAWVITVIVSLFYFFTILISLFI